MAEPDLHFAEPTGTFIKIPDEFEPWLIRDTNGRITGLTVEIAGRKFVIPVEGIQ